MIRRTDPMILFDYFVVSDRLMDRVEDAKIHTSILGSDHCPVELDLK